MNLKYRRILYLSFFAIFLAIAPALIIYSTGYRYNFKKNKFEKTGILYLDSMPKGAEIYFDEKYQGQTPARFSRLLPDQYLVEIKKNGYSFWQQKLEIKSNLTTFKRDVILFKKNLPINIINGEINILSLVPDQEKIIYSVINRGIEELKIYNLKNQVNLDIKKFDKKNYQQLEFISWSPNKTKMLLKMTIGSFNRYLIVDAETLKIKDLTTLTKLNFEKIKWNKNNDFFLYGLRKNALYQIDLIANTVNLAEANVFDFEIINDQFYLISQEKGEIYLKNKPIEDGSENDLKIIKLPKFSIYEFKDSLENFLILSDKKNNDLLVIKSQIFDSADINQSIILTDQAKKISWSKNFNQLLYFTDFEIKVLNLKSEEKELITRLSETIDDVIWHPLGSYLIYQTGNQIRALENYSSGEIKNDIILVEALKINSIFLDQNGKNLYFQGAIGQTAGIYQLEIQ
ncbi:MAG: hypothetical protein A3D39_03045 [Candidatus Buchananbacteria bacterium RIFCSPHIGHO2_02_FULL_39_17]|nr:MAG: hypothetical protein A3D39_03045 [Candidatus Buchananbacteria bacterium RIFCSPHIGHO2_02_FULL_39_17]